MSRRMRRMRRNIIIIVLAVIAIVAFCLSLKSCNAVKSILSDRMDTSSPRHSVTRLTPDKPVSTSNESPAVKKPPLIHVADPNVVSDDFTAAILDPRWFWVRENPGRWNLTGKPGCLSIITESGDLYEYQNNNRNILLMDAAAADFQLDTRVKIQPAANYHQAGLVIYQDDDNYVKLIRIYSGGNKIELFRETGGKGQEYQIYRSGTDVWLRLIKSGAVFTAFYSENGKDFQPVAETTNHLGGKLKIGLIAFHSTAGGNVTAQFDFFRVRYR